MHSAVLQSKDYIKFADKSTVEVISEGSLQKGVDAGDRKAETYEGERDGQKVEMMLSWPGLTLEEMLELNRSPGGQYNKSGKIPYTSIVDPHSLEEVKNFLGGQSSKSIIEAVEEYQKELKKTHGAGVSRSDLRRLDDAIVSVRELLEEGEFSKAISTLEKSAKDVQDWPVSIQDRVAKARSEVLEGAEAALAEVEGLVETDPSEAKRRLSRLQSKLRGTGLEDRAKEIKSEI